MPPNVKSVVEEPDRISWPDDHGASSSSFIDLDISLDALTRVKDYGRRSSCSGRPVKCKDAIRNGNAWGEANELQSNLHIEVGDRSFHLHKFPLISKSGKLNRLVFELRDPGKDRIGLHGVPGGAEAFEGAVRFLYGGSSNVEFTAGNVAALRCAAEFLEMDDRLGEGSLVAKTEQYLNLVVVGSWKDSIAALRSCSSDLEPWAEELEIMRRCSESVAWKASTDPHGLRWSDAKSSGGRTDWWFHDVCSLPIDAFTKVINAVVAKGMDSTTVAAVVTQYAENWLANVEANGHDAKTWPNAPVCRNRAVVHGIVSLLPLQDHPGSVIPCNVLLKLLRAGCAANAGALCKTDLARRIGAQLEKLAVGELLIPAYGAASEAAVYDIDVVHKIVETYYLQEQPGSARSPTKITSPSTTSVLSAATTITSSSSSVTSSNASVTAATTEKTSSRDEGRTKLDNRFKDQAEFFTTDPEPTRRPQLPATSSNLRVAHLLETLLTEIAKDSTIPVGKFVALADLFVDFPRESDDGIYRAVDTFLRSHPSLNGQERRRLCKVMDVHAFSLNACMHAAANERLPVRVAVQVLFMEQVKLRNSVVETPAAVNDKGVDSIAASFASWNSRDTAYSVDSSSSTPRLSTSTGTATPSSTHSGTSVTRTSAPPPNSSVLMPGGLTVTDVLRSAMSEIDLLRTAVQEIDTVKARLNSMDHVLQQEMDSINRKFMDLAAHHEYSTTTHQGEEATKGSKQKGGWASGWKKMAKPFHHGKDHPDGQRGCSNGLMLERHVKAVGDTLSTPVYQQMSILHPTDVPFLQCPKQPGAKFAAAPDQAPRAVVVAAASRVPDANGDLPAMVVGMPKVELPDLAIDIVAATCQTENVAQVKVDGAIEVSPPNANGEHDHRACSEEYSYQPPRPSVVSEEQLVRHRGSKDEPARQSVSKTNRAAHSQHRRHHHEHDRAHQLRSQHCPRTMSPHGRHSDAVSESSYHSHSSGHSHPRHHHSSSSHRSENRSHHSSSHGHGHAHKSSRHRHGSRSRSHSPEFHHRRSHHSPADHHRRSHYSPDHHHHHSKDQARASFATKHESDHHSSDHHHHPGRDPPRASSAAKHGTSDHHSSDHHHHHHSKDPPRASSAAKHGSDHHADHHHSKDPARPSSAAKVHASADRDHSDHHHHIRDPPRASSAAAKHGSDHHSSDQHHQSRDPPRARSAAKHGSDKNVKDPPRASSAAKVHTSSDRVDHSDHHHHHHSKDPPRTSSAGNHKTGSDHHSGHHRRSHHGGHQKHRHHTRDYDSASTCSSDSGPARPRRHVGE